MKTVMIGTPAYNGTVDVRYANALTQTIKMTPLDMYIFPAFLPYEALLQRARNNLCKTALEKKVDELVFIDADIFWKPEDFFRLLSHQLDIIGGVCLQKKDTGSVCYLAKGTPDENGIQEVEWTGCGFLKISSNALRKLWDISKKYTDKSSTTSSIFEISYENDELNSEDTTMCHKWKSLQGKIFIDTKIICGHTGTKIYLPS